MDSIEQLGLGNDMELDEGTCLDKNLGDLHPLDYCRPRNLFRRAEFREQVSCFVSKPNGYPNRILVGYIHGHLPLRRGSTALQQELPTMLGVQ